jgi:hypothetical protein
MPSRRFDDDSCTWELILTVDVALITSSWSLKLRRSTCTYSTYCSRLTGIHQGHYFWGLLRIVKVYNTKHLCTFETEIIGFTPLNRKCASRCTILESGSVRGAVLETTRTHAVFALVDRYIILPQLRTSGTFRLFHLFHPTSLPGLDGSHSPAYSRRSPCSKLFVNPAHCPMAVARVPPPWGRFPGWSPAFASTDTW